MQYLLHILRCKEDVLNVGLLSGMVQHQLHADAAVYHILKSHYTNNHSMYGQTTVLDLETTS